MTSQESSKEVVLLSGLPNNRHEHLQAAVMRIWALRWRMLGFTVATHQFGWYREQSYNYGMERLGDVISQFDRPILVGSSAGGLEALAGMYRYPDRVAGVETIASPIEIPDEQQGKYWGQGRIPQSMRSAYCEARVLLTDPRTDLSRIVSLYGEADDHVPPDWSQPEDMRIRRHEVAGRTHGSVIFGAMAINAARTAALLPDAA